MPVPVISIVRTETVTRRRETTVDTAELPPRQAAEVQWLLGRVNLDRVSRRQARSSPCEAERCETYEIVVRSGRRTARAVVDADELEPPLRRLVELLLRGPSG